MSVKDVLVFLDSDRASDGRLELARNVALAHNASLSAGFVVDDRESGMSIGLGLGGFPQVGDHPVANALAIPSGVQKSDSAEQSFHQCLRSISTRGMWHPLLKGETAKAITLARASDLVIVGQIDPRSRSKPALRPEDIILGSGRPVLIVPYVGRYATVGHRVLIAWDGSQEAVRATHDALSLIGAADMVTILTVYASGKDRDRDQPSLERFAQHLTRHGIAVRTDHTIRGSSTISDLLLGRAFDMSVDLIVAGAYHRSPLREALSGGVSRDLLQCMTVPILTSH